MLHGHAADADAFARRLRALIYGAVLPHNNVIVIQRARMARFYYAMPSVKRFRQRHAVLMRADTSGFARNITLRRRHVTLDCFAVTRYITTPPSFSALMPLSAALLLYYRYVAIFDAKALLVARCYDIFFIWLRHATRYFYFRYARYA